MELLSEWSEKDVTWFGVYRDSDKRMNNWEKDYGGNDSLQKEKNLEVMTVYLWDTTDNQY